MPAYHLHFRTTANVPSSGRAGIDDDPVAIARASSLPTCFTLRNFMRGAFTRSTLPIILPSLRRCPARQKLMFLRGRLWWRTVKGVAP